MRKLEQIRISWIKLKLRALVAKHEVESFPRRSANAMRQALLEVGDGLLCPTPEAYAELEGMRVWRRFGPLLAVGALGMFFWVGATPAEARP